ncbi:MAG: succinate--CoA ligase [Lentisphaerae bacterium GWF2_44_16]|nr:MAG: succinate--CoA ligase [Lentisphaerae bacterium GWF2_44_16]
MKLFEYQAKDIFEEAGIPVPKRKLIESASGLDEALSATGFPCVLKSQVLQGGRGKAGLIQFAKTGQEAAEKTGMLFSPEKNVRKILVEEALKIEKEIYLAITIDPVDCSALIMASSEGGMDIEEIALTKPDRIIKEKVNVFRSLMPYQARNIMFGLGLSGEAFKQGVKILTAMFGLFRKYDAELVEINPLALCGDGRLIAADGKFSIDDNASYRQKNFAVSRDHFSNDIEYEASLEGIPYLLFDGKIGLMCAGAGLTNTVYDLINHYGGSVSNYLEFGGPNYRKALEAMKFTLRSNPRVILIVTFGTIARADVMAQGIADAIKELKPEVPIVTAIRGTGEEDAAKILREMGLTPLSDTEDAVREAVRISEGGLK